MRLEWAEAALEDRETIFLQIARENLGAAIELDELLARQAHLLVDHPEAGRRGRVPGTRELVAHRHYILVYDLLPSDRVRILTVLHTSQQWPPLHAKKRSTSNYGRRGRRP